MYRVILNSCQNASLVEDQNHHVEILYKIATFIEFLFTRGKLFQVFEIMKTSPEYKGKLNHFKFFDGYNTHNAIDEVLNSNKIYRVRADNINVNEVRMISEEGLITDLFIGMHTNVDVMNNDVIVLEDLCFHDVNNPHIGNSATNKSYLMFPDFVGYLYKTIPFDVLSENIYFFDENLSEWMELLKHYQSVQTTTYKNKNKTLHRSTSISTRSESWIFGFKTKPPLRNPYVQNPTAGKQDAFKYLGANHIKIYKFNDKYYFDIDNINDVPHTESLSYIIGYFPHPYATKKSWYEATFKCVDTKPSCDVNHQGSWFATIEFLERWDLNRLTRSTFLLSVLIQHDTALDKLFSTDSVTLLNNNKIRTMDDVMNLLNEHIPLKIGNDKPTIKRYLLQCELAFSLKSNSRVKLLLSGGNKNYDMLKFTLSSELIDHSSVWVEATLENDLEEIAKEECKNDCDDEDDEDDKDSFTASIEKVCDIVIKKMDPYTKRNEGFEDGHFSKKSNNRETNNKEDDNLNESHEKDVEKNNESYGNDSDGSDNDECGELIHIN